MCARFNGESNWKNSKETKIKGTGKKRLSCLFQSLFRFKCCGLHWDIYFIFFILHLVWFVYPGD